MAAAVVGDQHRAADEAGVRTHSQRLEHIDTEQDAAVNEYLRLALDRFHNFRQHLRRAGRIGQHTTAVVGHNDSIRTCVYRLLGGVRRHDALDDHRRFGVLPQFRHGLGAALGVQPPEMGQTGAVHHDTHGGRQQPALILIHQLLDLLHRGGIEHRNTVVAVAATRGNGLVPHARRQAVAESMENTPALTGGHTLLVEVADIVRGVELQLQRADRRGQQREGQLPTQQLRGGINRRVLHIGIHVQLDGASRLEVVVGAVARRFGAGAGNGVAAAKAVADRTDLALGADALSGVFQYLCVFHVYALLM